MERLRNVLVAAALMIGVCLIKHPDAEAVEIRAPTNAQRTSGEAAFLSPDHRPLPAGDSSIESGAVNTRDGAPPIRATRLISIPYGFNSPLSVLDDGRDVVARGHGACTEQEQVTVAITITQTASGAVATGEMEQTCTGALQTWWLRATADTPSSFTTDAAEACGIATTRDAGYVTDTFEWCRGVDLIRLDRRAYLPFILKP